MENYHRHCRQVEPKVYWRHEPVQCSIAGATMIIWRVQQSSKLDDTFWIFWSLGKYS